MRFLGDLDRLQRRQLRSARPDPRSFAVGRSIDDGNGKRVALADSLGARRPVRVAFSDRFCFRGPGRQCDTGRHCVADRASLGNADADRISDADGCSE